MIISGSLEIVARLTSLKGIKEINPRIEKKGRDPTGCSIRIKVNSIGFYIYSKMQCREYRK